MASVRSITIAAAVVTLLGVVCVLGALALPFNYAGGIGPAWIPLVIGILLIISAVAYWSSERKNTETIEWADRRGWVTIAGIFGCLVVFLVLINTTTFAIGVGVFTFLFLSLISRYPLVKKLVISVLSAAVIHATFVELLRLPLPGAW